MRPFHDMMLEHGEHLQQAASRLAFAEKAVCEMSHDEILALIGLLHELLLSKEKHAQHRIFIGPDLPGLGPNHRPGEELS